MGSLLLPPGSWCAHYFVSPSPVKVLQSNPASLQSLILWEFLLPLPDHQVGKTDVGLRTFTPVGGLLWYKCSPVCESPTQWLWDLILLWLCPSYRLLCLWMWGIFFGEFQCLPVDDCSAVSCDSGLCIDVGRLYQTLTIVVTRLEEQELRRLTGKKGDIAVFYF